MSSQIRAFVEAGRGVCSRQADLLRMPRILSDEEVQERHDNDVCTHMEDFPVALDCLEAVLDICGEWRPVEDLDDAYDRGCMDMIDRIESAIAGKLGGGEETP